MTIENIRDTGRNSARTVDVRVLAEKIQKPSDTEAVVAANVITAAESGTRFVMNVAAAKVSTLPAPAAGLEYWFYVGATEPTGTHTIVTASSANIIVGNVSSPEDAAGSVATVTDADTISLVAKRQYTEILFMYGLMALTGILTDSVKFKTVLLQLNV